MIDPDKMFRVTWRSHKKIEHFCIFEYFFSSFFFLSHIFCILLQLHNWRIFLSIFSTNSLFYVKIYRYFWLYFLHSEFCVDTFSLCIWISNICYSVFSETFFSSFFSFFLWINSCKYYFLQQKILLMKIFKAKFDLEKKNSVTQNSCQPLSMH